MGEFEEVGKITVSDEDLLRDLLELEAALEKEKTFEGSGKINDTQHREALGRSGR
jgi:hypothetical protein